MSDKIKEYEGEMKGVIEIYPTGHLERLSLIRTSVMLMEVINTIPALEEPIQSLKERVLNLIEKFENKEGRYE